MTPFSILDLAPITEGSSISQALENSKHLAITAENCGYRRVWLAEHHGMQGVASSATAVVLAHIGAATSTIRIGSGGIMLPNHSPLIVAEQFGTLAALFPERVDLGLGRAPGTDMATARALNRDLNAAVEDYPAAIQQLQRYLGTRQAGQSIIAIPGIDTHIPLWLLGSSLYSAQLAAQLGLPYSFASHFAPDQLITAINLYREHFRPSEQLQTPYVMAGVMAVVADTDEEAKFLFTSVQQQFVNMRRGLNKPFARPVDDMSPYWSASEQAMVEHTLQYALVGSKPTVEAKLQRFIEATQIDELIVSVPVHNMAARLNTVEQMADIGSLQSN
ncbi:LLM class flavin-dependent oxidoreductase [Aliiglaciecola sp. LCG003]|uniref:LLM class flavin-dependent oxidoreductase n=1 Tax=Aliiglaciecola sp. LCG003 TaxID=3053655 RepID=UPI002573BCB0|nr:LLM class flavin-dependent oxidoreductase [Aliiglaciecola sp. LCG003]WJG10115.1 LLM class flavin-dependent oxidoreductase [Aliiglaciecola sp. LCG003]